MKKKFGGVALIAVIALMAVPVMASATTLYSGGTPIPVGTELVGKSGSVYLEAYEKPGGNLLASYNCTGSEWKGTVVQNIAAPSAAMKTRIDSYQFSGTGAEGKCPAGLLGPARISVDVPTCLYSFWWKELDVRTTGAACNTVSTGVKLTLIHPTGTCHYSSKTYSGGRLYYGIGSSDPLTVSYLMESPKNYLALEESSGTCWGTLRLVNPGTSYSIKTAAGASVKIAEG